MLVARKRHSNGAMANLMADLIFMVRENTTRRRPNQSMQDRLAALRAIAPGVAQEDVAAGAVIPGQPPGMLFLDRYQNDSGNKIRSYDQPAGRGYFQKIMNHALAAKEEIKVAGGNGHNP